MTLPAGGRGCAGTTTAPKEKVHRRGTGGGGPAEGSRGRAGRFHYHRRRSEEKEDEAAEAAVGTMTCLPCRRAGEACGWPRRRLGQCRDSGRRGRSARSGPRGAPPSDPWRGGTPRRSAAARRPWSVVSAPFVLAVPVVKNASKQREWRSCCWVCRKDDLHQRYDGWWCCFL